MGFFQVPIKPVPNDLEFNGKIAIVTGATSGIGLEISRQLLQHGVAHLILAVRNIKKGEAVRQQLLSESAVRDRNPGATAEVVKLDTASYRSVKEFTSNIKAKHGRLDILMLNAGIAIAPEKTTAEGHETMVQVNYLSTVLLLLELLPLLEATSTVTGHPSRVTLTGSRSHYQSTLRSVEIPENQTLLEFLDDPKSYDMFKRYSDTKLLVYIFLEELGSRYNPEHVIINHFCPGLIATNIAEDFPFWVRVPSRLYMKIRARPLPQGGWSALHTLGVAGAESHGHMIHDKELVKPTPDDFIFTEAGKKMQNQLWKETIKELDSWTTIPPWALVDRK